MPSQSCQRQCGQVHLNTIKTIGAASDSGDSSHSCMQWLCLLLAARPSWTRRPRYLVALQSHIPNCVVRMRLVVVPCLNWPELVWLYPRKAEHHLRGVVPNAAIPARCMVENVRGVDCLLGIGHLRGIKVSAGGGIEPCRGRGTAPLCRDQTKSWTAITALAT